MKKYKEFEKYDEMNPMVIMEDLIQIYKDNEELYKSKYGKMWTYKEVKTAFGILAKEVKYKEIHRY